MTTRTTSETGWWSFYKWNKPLIHHMARGRLLWASPGLRQHSWKLQVRASWTPDVASQLISAGESKYKTTKRSATSARLGAAAAPSTYVCEQGWVRGSHPRQPSPLQLITSRVHPPFSSYSSRFEIFTCFLSRKWAAGHRKPQLLHTARASPLLPKRTTQEAAPRVPVPPVRDRDPSPDSEEPLPRVISDSWAGSQPVSPRGKADATSVGVAAKRSIGWTTAWNNSLLQ